MLWVTLLGGDWDPTCEINLIMQAVVISAVISWMLCFISFA
jgi:hypothetical protein